MASVGGHQLGDKAVGMDHKRTGGGWRNCETAVASTYHSSASDYDDGDSLGGITISPTKPMRAWTVSGAGRSARAPDSGSTRVRSSDGGIVMQRISDRLSEDGSGRRGSRTAGIDKTLGGNDASRITCFHTNLCF